MFPPAVLRRVHSLPLIALLLSVGSCSDAPSGSDADGSESAPVPPVTHEGFVEVDDSVRLFFRAVGAGEDTVVVVHGGPGFTMDYFLADLSPLAERHALIFYDQRGTGGSSLVSDSSALDAERFVEDLEALRRHFGLERLTILGHSWGAGVAALYAAAHPENVERLLMVGAIPLRRGPLVEAFQDLDAGRDTATRRQMNEWHEARLADPGDASACRAYYVLWFQPFFGDSTAMSRSEGDFCAGGPDALRNKMNGVDRFTMASLGDWDWRPALRALPAPTLVIHGTADPLPLEGAREWVTTAPEGRLLLLEGVGHFPYLEAPERFFPAVSEFVEGRWPAGAEAVP